MKSRILAISSWLCLSAVFYACGDDDNPPPETDGGVDGGEAGSGGAGGKGGSGGGGKGGSGGSGGSGGQGGSGGSGGNGADEYTVSGEVSGLNGSGLVIKLGDEELEIDDDGDFTFPNKLAKGDDYEVIVETQPSDPVQACEVTNGSGEIDDANIDNVEIACSDVKRSIGGTISGLGGDEIKLKNNNGEILTVGADGNFSFPLTLAPGAGYTVTIDTLPNGRTCSLTKATGTTGGSNVTDVTIACYAGLTLSARARVASVGLSWNNNGAQSYTVYRATNANCDFDNFNACSGKAEQANVTSPFNWGADNGTAYYFHVRGNHPDNFQTKSATTGAPGARPNTAEIDGTVKAIARGGEGTVYIGGEFTSVGPLTGPAAPIDRTTGLASRMANFPVITGPGSPVSAIAADGSGGYFVGGTFEFGSGETLVRNLAHVTSEGVLDTTWRPNPNTNATGVSHLTLVGSTLYLLGSFSEVYGEARAGIAAVTTSGAGMLTMFNPDPTPAASVSYLVANGDAVFVAGDFDEIGGQPRTEIARLNPADGTAHTWSPVLSSAVSALALANDALYVAGNFTMIDGMERVRLAGFQLSDGMLLPNFAPQPTSGNAPSTMAVGGELLYLGGNFSDITVGATPPSARARLAAVNRTNGAVADWNPGADQPVQALAVDGDTVYVAGDFLNIGTTPRKYLAAIGTDGTVDEWNPQPQREVNGLAVDDNQVYAFGGAIRSFGVESHQGLAAFQNGVLTTWGPPVTAGVGSDTGSVGALAVDGTTIYVGGDFDNVGGMARSGVAAVSDASAVLGWNANLAADAEVDALAVANGRVYIGGEFTLGSATNLVALATSNGAVATNWALTDGVDDEVLAIVLDGTGANVFVGGAFSAVGATPRDSLVKLDAVTGALAAGWTTEVTGVVNALAIVGDNLYVGGEFTEINGNDYANIAGVGLADPGAPTNFVPVLSSGMALDGPVNALAGIGDVLYIGGTFNNYGIGLAVVDTGESPPERATGVLQAGDLGGINALAVSADNIYIGGDLSSTSGDAEAGACRNYCSRALPMTPP